jgi:signal transduction histidine kinase
MAEGMQGSDQNAATRPVLSGFLDRTLSKSVKRAVIAQGIAILALVWGYTAWRLNDDRQQTLETARQNLRTSAGALHAQVVAVLNDGLGAARAGANEAVAQGGVERLSNAELTELLKRHLTGGEYVRVLFVATPTRFVAVGRNRPPIAWTHPPDWLQRAFTGAGDRYDGGVVHHPGSSSGPLVPIAMRVSGPGEQQLWAGALISMQWLDSLYHTMSIDDGMLALVSGTGEPLLRVPAIPAERLGKNLPQRDALFREGADLPGEEALMVGTSPITRTPWIYAVRRFADTRAMAVAGRNTDSILAPWRERSLAIGQVLVAISVLVILLTVLLKRLIEKLARREIDLENRVADRTAALQEANLRLAMTNQELEAFAASASHDLRSPLMTIAGQAGLLQRELRPQMSETIRRRIDRITKGVKHSSEIVEGLLSLARLTSQDLLTEPVDLTAFAHAVVDDLRHQYPNHAVECSVADGMTLEADPRLMQSLLANLLGNAWKYTSKCSSAQVSLRCSRDTDPPVFSISDNGAGFDMVYAQGIFQPFQRLHSAAEYPGIGIGLATVSRIVQRYGGKIWVESQRGKGTTFHFTLPMAIAARNKQVRVN